MRVGVVTESSARKGASAASSAGVSGEPSLMMRIS